MEDTIIQEERESIEQEIEHKETYNKGIENSLKEKQKHILTTLKDYRRKNGTDILWLIIWIVVLGGAMYIKRSLVRNDDFENKYILFLFGSSNYRIII